VSAGARRLPPPRAAAFGWVRGVRLRTPAAAINRPAERLPALVLANFLFSELGGYNTKRRGTRGAEISTAYPDTLSSIEQGHSQRGYRYRFICSDKMGRKGGAGGQAIFKSSF